MKIIKKYRGNSGYALIFTLFALFLLFAFCLTISAMAVSNLNHVKKIKFGSSALCAAESGVMRGLTYLKSNRAWDGTTDGSGEESKLTFLDEKMPGGFGTYTVRVYNNLNGSGAIPAPRGISVPPGGCYLYSEGKSNLNSNRYVSVMMGGSSLFGHGIFSTKDGVRLNGNIDITAYDPSSGSLVPGAASVATNNAETGAVVVNGTAANIDGTLFAGPGANVDGNNAIIFHGSPTIGGDPPKDALQSERNFPPVEVPTGLPKMTFTGNYNLAPGDYSDEDALRLQNDDYFLTGAPGGAVYIFNGIHGSGNPDGMIKVDTTNGPVKIYFTGDVKLSGHSGIVDANDPQSQFPDTSNIQIFLTSDVTDIDLSGQALIHGAVYAPDTNLDMRGNSDMFGAIVANDIWIRGTAEVHYDVELKNILSDDSLTVKCWAYF